ncbi:hypothetical protein [Bacillus sp. 1P06AnD]|uniref:hypothetical protein n=1 Tax=Bacillus sp. 1P06AnD TaxID=3132208 RepID=UPI0039A2A213
MDITISDYTKDHTIVSVIHRGRQYGTTWAKEYNDTGSLISPTIEQVKEAFEEDRSNFELYSIKRGY